MPSGEDEGAQLGEENGVRSSRLEIEEEEERGEREIAAAYVPYAGQPK